MGFLIARPATIQKAIYRTLEEVENPIKTTGVKSLDNGGTQDAERFLRTRAMRRLQTLRGLLK